MSRVFDSYMEEFWHKMEMSYEEYKHFKDNEKYSEIKTNKNDNKRKD